MWGQALLVHGAYPAVRRTAVVLGLTVALSIVPAAAQMRTDIGSRINVGPRMMSPGSFGMRLDPTFRTSPGAAGEATRGETVKTDTVNTDTGRGGRKPPTRTITKKGDDGGKQPSTTAGRVAGMPPAGERRYVPDEVIIEIAGNPSEAAVQALASRFRLTRLESRPLTLTSSTFFRWRIPDRRSVPDVIRALAGAAVSAQPNYLYGLSQQDTAALPPAGPGGDPAQYALTKLRLGEAHGFATGNAVAVAVIDSGIDATHPELEGVVTDSFDALDSKEGPHAHGTGVAGIIAAHARLKGAAPKVKILAVRAFGTSQGSTFSVVKGLDWAASKNARVVNMSFTGPSDPLLARALSVARGRGVILVAAAGNAGPKSKPLYPAADAGVIAVTATDADDKLFAMANRGAYVAVAAPGVDILMPSPGEGYWVSTGTSMAAAYVSGVVALVLERQPRLDGEAVRKLLVSTARDLGPKGRDDQFGAGLIDAYQAIMALEAKAAEAAAPAAARR